MVTMTDRQSFRDTQGHLRHRVWVVCPNCEVGRWMREESKQRKTFTRLCRKCNAKNCLAGKKGDTNPNWKGGRYKNEKGYTMVLLSSDDFFYPMATARGYVQEHRLVVAKALKRCLLSWEVVHHKGAKYPQGSIEDKSDNRYPENLELLPSRSYHLVDSTIKALVKKLERTISQQIKIIASLNEQIKELDN